MLNSFRFALLAALLCCLHPLDARGAPVVSEPTAEAPVSAAPDAGPVVVVAPVSAPSAIAPAAPAPTVISWLRAGDPPNWQLIAAALWLAITAILKASTRLRANEPLELVANVLIKVPLVGQLARAWTTPGTVVRTSGPPSVALVLAMLSVAMVLPGCATFAPGHYVAIPPDPAACAAAGLAVYEAQKPCDVSPRPPVSQIIECAVGAILAARPCAPATTWVPDPAPPAAK